MRTKYIMAPLFILFTFAVLSLGPARVWSNVQQAYNKWMILTMILDKIQRFYVEEKDPDTLLKHAIDGMLSGLDPHSQYIPSEQVRDYAVKYEGYFGVGLNYSIVDRKYMVTSLVRNGPAVNAGVKIGDRIQRIDGRSVSEMSPEQAERILSGNTEALVVLDLLRPPLNEPLHFELAKRRIDLPSVESAFMLNADVGCIQISHFSASTATEADRAFNELLALGMTRLVLDLRNNGGGALEAGVAVADRLIPPGKLIVFTRGRAPQSSEQFISSAAKTWPMLPLIVLVNEKTASDAEIVAGAVQDWDRGIVVGRKTYGKALVQTEYPFQDGSRLLLTTARYYTPLGRMIQIGSDKTNQEPKTFRTAKGRLLTGGGGIRPDFEIKKNGKPAPAIIRKLYGDTDNYFYQFADETVNLQREALPASLSDFLTGFAVTDDLWRRFVEMTVVGAQGKITRSEIEQNRAEVATELKIALAWRLWGDEGRDAASAFADDEIQKSLTFLPDAAALLAN